MTCLTIKHPNLLLIKTLMNTSWYLQPWRKPGKRSRMERLDIWVSTLTPIISGYCILNGRHPSVTGETPHVETEYGTSSFSVGSPLTTRCLLGTNISAPPWLKDAFALTYYGTAVDGFYDYLTKNEHKFQFQEPDSYYAKFCSIVQSSGTGKSRLVTEVRADHSIQCMTCSPGIVAP